MPTIRNNYLLISGLLMIGIVFGAGGLYFYLQSEGEITPEISRLKDRGTAAVGASDDSVVYNNERYGFQLKYPKGLVLKEFDEGGDSWTTVFQKPGERVGFQVYITPHPGKTIDGKTILRDVPSGKIDDLKEEYIRPDILAATFWSEAPLTGRNREIWFLHDGYIYEFTAYDAVEGWLREILQTLEFTK